MQPRPDVANDPDEIAVEPSSLTRGAVMLSKKSVTVSVTASGALPMISNKPVPSPTGLSVRRRSLFGAGLGTAVLVTGLSIVGDFVVYETVVGDSVMIDNEVGESVANN